MRTMQLHPIVALFGTTMGSVAASNPVAFVPSPINFNCVHTDVYSHKAILRTSQPRKKQRIASESHGGRSTPFSSSSSKLNESGMNNDDIVNYVLSNQNNDSSNAENDNKQQRQRKPQDPYSRYTHQIAIPLSEVSDLHSALRPIQTSLVRDCPRLIRACIMPALLRLPLLYVDAGSADLNKLIGGGNGNVVTNDYGRTGGVFGFGGGNSNVDSILEQVVHRSIRKVVYGESEDENDLGKVQSTWEDGTATSTTTAISSSSTVQMAEPILLPFRGLELQGEDNSVLYAVGSNINEKNAKNKKKSSSVDDDDDDDDDDGVYIVDDWGTASTTTANGAPSGWEILEKLVNTIQNDLEQSYGMDTCWPLDEPQGAEIFYSSEEEEIAKKKPKKWRPRVPFVRLPSEFYQDLENDLVERQSTKGGKEINDDKDGKEVEFDPLAKGLDGISPLFWYEAWGDEEILPAPGARMRSIAIYRRMAPGGGEAESSFYMPTSSEGSNSWNGMGGAGAGEETSWNNSMDLPMGDTKTMARERREKAIEMERMGNVERRAEREWEEGKAKWIEEERMALVKGVNSVDNMSLWDDDIDDDDDSYMEMDIGIEMGEITVEGDAAYSSPWSERGVEITSKDLESNESTDTNASKAKRSTSETNNDDDAGNKQTSNRNALQENTTPKRELPDIENNPVFQRLWKGQPQLTAKGQTVAQSLEGSAPSSAPAPLPPYPSDEHFVGIWRVVSSPLGTEDIPMEGSLSYSSASPTSSSSSSDNLIFRVDGTTMGGPILNAEFRHKAAGGTWNMFQAVRKSTREEGQDAETAPPITQTRLRVRLLVPPEKEKVLVMEGEVTRMKFPGTQDETTSSSSSDSWMIGSGGLLEGMALDVLDADDADDLTARGNDAGSKGETLLYCGGETWLEDANIGGNRKKLGPFSLMKLKTPDRDKLIYTVPASKITVSTDEDDESDSEE